MPKRSLGVDCVPVAPSVSLAGDYVGFLEFGDNALDGSLGDADLGGDISQACLRVAEEAHQDVGVVGEKCPAIRGFE